MKSLPLALLSPLLAASLSCYAAERLIPAGSIIQCTVSEPKLSSKTAAIGDPVLCQVGYTERYGRSVLPYDSYMEGRFEDYKDPGHFVGKGWMELKFDRMVLGHETVIPISARVVGVPGYNVDREGRIRGKGHAVRDTVEWLIPILWPIDILNLPRRGPRPTLREETRLTLKVMDDLAVPGMEGPLPDPNGLLRRTPSAYTPPPPAEETPRAPAVPVYHTLAAAPPPAGYVYSGSGYIAPPPLAPASGAPAWSAAGSGAVRNRIPYLGPEDQDSITIVFNDGRPQERVHNYMLTPSAIYVLDPYRRKIPLDEVDLAATVSVNRAAGADFRAPGSNGR